MAEKKEEKKGEIDISEITSKVSDEVSSKVAVQLEELSKKIDSKKEEKDESDFSWLEEDMEEKEEKKESTIKASTLEKFAEKLLGSVRHELDKYREESSRLVDRKIDAKESVKSINIATLRDFPMLNPNSPEHDKEFVDLVRSEINARVARGRSEQDPDLIYDAAAGVKARSNKWNTSQKEEAEKEVRRANNRDASFQIRGSGKQDKTTLSAYQLQLARESGLKDDRMKELFKKYNLGS